MLRIPQAVLLGLVLVFVSAGFSQQPDNAAPKPDKASTKQKPPRKPAAGETKPKLTADQELGYQTLELAEGQARGLEAPMRSYSLLQIAAAYSQSDPPKARKLLQDSFSASLAIHDDDDTKRDLQTEIFRTLLPISQADVEERLPQAEPGARKQASQIIIGNYTQKKQFNQAIDLIQQLTSWDEFPYSAATRLFEVMPAEMSAEKQALFASAVASYRAHDHNGTFMGSIETMISRFGASMPPKLALEAIDEVLSQAKQNTGKFSMSVGGAEGSATFKNQYEYLLFTMLPLLRKLDETRADQLLEDNAPLKSTIQRFPNGMDSISPKPVAAPGKDAPPAGGGTMMRIMAGSNADLSGETAIRAEMQRRTDLILKLAETDPTQAVAQSTALPVTVGPFQPSPRAGALEAIARMSVKKQPAGARTALAELRKSVKDMQPRDQIEHLSTAAKLYLDLGDKDKAEDVVTEGLVVAGKMLDDDMNPDDPNKALKAWWPSADAYRRFVEIETGISHPAAAKLVQELKDPEIRTTESIVFGRALIGIPAKRYKLVTNKNSAHMNLTMAEP
jgi:hypothetical protein